MSQAQTAFGLGKKKSRREGGISKSPVINRWGILCRERLTKRKRSHRIKFEKQFLSFLLHDKSWLRHTGIRGFDSTAQTLTNYRLMGSLGDGLRDFSKSPEPHSLQAGRVTPRRYGVQGGHIVHFKHSIRADRIINAAAPCTKAVGRPRPLDSPILFCGIVRPWMSVDACLPKILVSNSSPLQTVCRRRLNRGVHCFNERPMAVLPTCRM